MVHRLIHVWGIWIYNYLIKNVEVCPMFFVEQSLRRSAPSLAFGAAAKDGGVQTSHRMWASRWSGFGEAKDERGFYDFED